MSRTAPAPRPHGPARPGIAALEVALLLPLLAGLLYLLAEGGAMLRTYSALAEASRAAARQVIVGGDSAAAPDLVRSLLPDLASGSLATSVTTDAGATSVTVEVSYAYQTLFSSSPLGGSHEPLVTLAAKTCMPIP